MTLEKGYWQVLAIVLLVTTTPLGLIRNPGIVVKLAAPVILGSAQ